MNSQRTAVQSSGGRGLALVMAACAAFVLVSSRWLPPVVASHFDAAGQVNGAMPRHVYMAIMTVLILVAPGVVGFAASRSLDAPDARINLPHGDYWLAPPQRERTLADLRAFFRRFAAALALFLCYAHALVLRANLQQPPQLDTGPLVLGLAVFLLSLGAWTAALLRRFRTLPDHG
jgi:hypothetical protein